MYQIHINTIVIIYLTKNSMYLEPVIELEITNIVGKLKPKTGNNMMTSQQK